MMVTDLWRASQGGENCLVDGNEEVGDGEMERMMKERGSKK